MEALLKPTPLTVPSPDRGAQAQALSLLTTSLEARIPWAAGHSRRVARYAAGLAKQMDLGREQITQVGWAAALHDIGKLEMPARIVNKPGPLSELEFAMVRRHAAIGARIVSRLGDEELAAIVRHHHERIDGRGYPDGLAGEEIPLGARIVAVADTFDALTSTRPYRAAQCHREVLDLLDAEAGTQLDPDVVVAFHRYYVGRRGLRLRMLAR